MVVLFFLATMVCAQDDTKIVLLNAIPRLLDDFDNFSDQHRVSKDFKKNSQEFLKNAIYRLIGISPDDRAKLLDPKTSVEDVTAIRYKIGAQRNAWSKHIPPLRKALKDPEALIDSIKTYVEKIKEHVPSDWYSVVQKWIDTLKTDHLDAFKKWAKATTKFIDDLDGLSKEYVGKDFQVLGLTTEEVEHWFKDTEDPVSDYAKAIDETLKKPFDLLMKGLKSLDPAIIDFPALKNSLAEEIDRLTSQSKPQILQEEEPQNGTPVRQKKTIDLKHATLDEK